jgi:hypothetical protein
MQGYAGRMTALWAVLAFLLGWKLAASSGGNPAVAAHAVSTAAKNTVHQAVTQASSTILSVVWDVTWHLALIVIVIAAVIAAVRYGLHLLIRRNRGSLSGR